MKNGFIKLYRKLQNHWLWKDKPFTKGQAWIDILMECNHTEQKINIGNHIYICGIGESLNSCSTWAKRWGWTTSKVKRFLKLLKTDLMIDKKPNQHTTHLKVLNYSVYANKRTASEPQMNRKRTASEPQTDTNNNDKKEKNEKNKEICEHLFNFWNEQDIKIHRKLTDKMKLKMRSALKDYTIDEIEASIQRYSIIVDDDKYYFSYIWGLADFLQRGIEKFNTDICFKNFKKDKE